MGTSMHAELLKSIPLSGTYPEVQFDVGINSTWVKFLDANYDEWCGVFGGGNSNYSCVEFSENSEQAFVVSAGQGYLVDIEERTLRYKTDLDDLTLIAKKKERNVARGY